MWFIAIIYLLTVVMVNEVYNDIEYEEDKIIPYSKRWSCLFGPLWFIFVIGAGVIIFIIEMLDLDD